MQMRASLLLLLFISSQQVFGWNDECTKYRNAGMKHYYKQKYDSALIDFEALVACKSSPDNYYDAACVAALSGQKSKAFAYLHKSLSLGFGDSTLMVTDQDLNNLRQLEEWSSMLEKFSAVRKRIRTEIGKIATIPSRYVLPYEKDERWGYMDIRTKKAVCEAMFDKLSLIGNKGLGRLGNYNFQFSPKGKIGKLKAVSGGFSGLVAYEELSRSRSLNKEKGFSYVGSKFEFGSKYTWFYPFFSAGVPYALVKDRLGKHWVDSSGTKVQEAAQVHRLIYHNYGKDSKRGLKNLFDEKGDFYVFVVDSLDRVGFTNLRQPVLWISKVKDFKKPVGDVLEEQYENAVNRYVYLKRKNSWGIWDCKKKDWQIKAKYDKVIRTERSVHTVNGNYGKVEVLKLYFLVEQKGKRFYVDLQGSKYIVKN